jgi:uncharacterized protein YjbJ (UPF0337 family)
MNKDQGQGWMKQLAGKAKELAGKAMGDNRLRAKGAIQETAGKGQTGYGNAKDSLNKDAK